LLESNTAPNKPDRPIDHKAVSVVVTLTSQDYKNATSAARSSHENLAEWISSLVHTALQP
jgi:hypothetical protein